MSLHKQFGRFKFPVGILLSLFLHPVIFFGQLPAYEVNNGASIHLTGTIFLNDIFKNIYHQTKYPDIKGSPFYLDDWKSADIALKDGKHFDSVKVKLNLYSQEIVCLSSPGSEITLKDGIVDRLVLRDTNDLRLPSIHIFASGIPLAEKVTGYPIFEVLSDGKAILLNLITKRIAKSADVYSAGEQKEFVALESLYVYYNSELKKCGKNAEFYTTLFSDRKHEMEEFIRVGKLKCRNTKEVIQLVNYYNSL
jgi:hypothetical protein